MKKISLALVLVSMFAAGSAFAAAKAKPAPKASKADCEKANANMYKLSGTEPTDDAKKTNLAKCQKDQTKAATDCVSKATSMEELGACKGK